MRSALVARDRVDLVDDHGVDRAQGFPPTRAGDQQVERLRRRDDERRRLADHPRPLRVRGVAGAHRDADVGRVETELGGDLGDLAQRSLEVLGDVDRERLQRRHVDDARDAVDRLAGVVGAVEPVDADEEAGERLPRAGRRRDERVGARGDVRPGVALRRGGTVGEPAPEPCADRGVEAVDLVRDAEHQLTGLLDDGRRHALILASAARRA